MSNQNLSPDTSSIDIPAAELVPTFDPGSIHSDNLPRLLQALDISIALTSYQSNRLMLVRSNAEKIDILFQDVPRPMGLAISAERMVVGSWAQILDYRRFDAAIANTPDADCVDACFVPRGSLVTGNINVHDIAWGDSELWVVNSMFSCLATLSPDYNFVPRWLPPFIDRLTPDDSCHLNGMAMRDGKPAFVTTFCRTGQSEAWRAFKGDGTVIGVASKQVIVDNLLMPHSPRWIAGWLYFCESGYGRVWRCRDDGREMTLIAELPGFTRGIDHVGSLLFIGVSKARSSEGAPRLPLRDQHPETVCGFWVLDLTTLEEVGWLLFTGSVSQIYDLVLMHGMTFPHVMEWQDDALGDVYCFPPI